MNESDYQEIYQVYFKDVYRYVLSLSNDATVAEEVTQETFFKALKHFDRFHGTCKLFTWLCQIAKNTLHDHRKKEKKYLPLENRSEQEDPRSDVESGYLVSEQAKTIHRLLHHLKEPYKEVFSLRVFAELSFSQIGELFEKSDSWARVVFYRAKNQIQEELK